MPYNVFDNVFDIYSPTSPKLHSRYGYDTWMKLFEKTTMPAVNGLVIFIH